MGRAVKDGMDGMDPVDAVDTVDAVDVQWAGTLFPDPISQCLSLRLCASALSQAEPDFADGAGAEPGF